MQEKMTTDSAVKNKSHTSNLTCCLVDDGERCSRSVGYATYRRFQKFASEHSEFKLSEDKSAHHMYICSYHKQMLQERRRQKDSDDDSGRNDDVPEVDLYQLQFSTLRRYDRHYKVTNKHSNSKAHLAYTLMKHFKTIPVVEKDALRNFICLVRQDRGESVQEKRKLNRK